MDILEEVRLARKWAEEEFDHLHNVESVLRSGQDSFFRTVRRKAQRLHRKARRRQRIVTSKVNEVILLLSESRLEKDQRERFRKQLKVHVSNLLRFVDDTIAHSLKPFDRETALGEVQAALKGSMKPLVGTLSQIEHALQSLRGNDEPHALVVDLDGVVGHPANRTTILDADFVRKLEEEKEIRGDKLVTVRLSGKIIIPTTVWAEMRRPYLAPLISRRLRNYLTHQLHARTEKIHVPKVTWEKIWPRWRRTRKGAQATEKLTRKFRSSGDIQIIAYCLDHSNQNITVLSNDKDVSGTINQFKARGSMYKVFVYRYDHGRVLRAA